MESESSSITSQKYHDIFDFKLTKEELVKWQYKNKKEKTTNVKNKTRLQREKYSQAKLVIAKKAGKILSKIPTIKFIGITGALAMMNADKNSDIDLMVITRAGQLWTTRLVAYMIIWLFGFKIRKPVDSDEEDKLCLNIWLDETDLIWNKTERNIYTAHEIGQVRLLVNKDKTYEKFLYANKWILKYWPNSVKIENHKLQTTNFKQYVIEKIVFKIQYLYMKSKITREVVTSTRAIFHPKDWGKVVKGKLKR